MSKPDATKGVCDQDCGTTKFIYPFLFVLIFLTLAATVPVVSTTIRFEHIGCVPLLPPAYEVRGKVMF